jgi:phosphoadenosine phosphosulfate reductase
MRQRVEALRQAYGHLDGLDLLAAMHAEFPGRLAVISSFGVEAAALLALVAELDRALPVIFLDTGELFDETLAYQVELTDFLGLTGLQVIRPAAKDLVLAEGLWQRDPDACCHIRKVLPLDHAIRGFSALVDGRKRFHGGERETVETIDAAEDGLIKISPLARWRQDQIDAVMTERGLPRHPLLAQGYRSVGCWPCSQPIGPDEPLRAGRWAGAAKTECGIHKVSKTP